MPKASWPANKTLTRMSLLSDLLFKEIQPPVHGKGRLIKFNESELDIEFATGTMGERILAFLLKAQEPLTSAEIARGIGSSASKVSVAMKPLLRNGDVQAIAVEGCHREYLRAP